MKTILIYILVYIIIILADGIPVYIHYRRKWVANFSAMFARFVFFTILMRKINNKETLLYNTETLFQETIKSFYELFFSFWIWNTRRAIKNREMFHYLSSATQEYSIEFSLYWAIFVENGANLTADNIKRYNDIIRSEDFKKMSLEIDQDTEKQSILH